MSEKLDHRTIAAIISNAEKTTPAKVYIAGSFQSRDFEKQPFKAFGDGDVWILIGDYEAIHVWMKENGSRIRDVHADIAARYSALPLLDLRDVEARVEPGAVIRYGASIGKDCIIMMGAVINIGAEIGPKTMVDMNAVIGARATIGRNCHIGAGAVVAGVLEPPGKTPVRVEDNVLIGANAVLLEGVRIGKGSVVAAGAVVLEDVQPGVVVAGIPAKVIRRVEDMTDKGKIAIVDSLRRRK